MDDIVPGAAAALPLDPQKMGKFRCDARPMTRPGSEGNQNLNLALRD